MAYQLKCFMNMTLQSATSKPVPGNPVPPQSGEKLLGAKARCTMHA